VSSIHPPSPEPLNPYQAPLSDVLDTRPEHVEFSDLAEAERLRNIYLKHEASVKSVGSLHYFGAVCGLIVCICAVAMIVVSIREENPGNTGVFVGVSAIYVVMTAVNFALGYGLRRLLPWARWTEIILGSIGTFIILSMTIFLAATANSAAAAPNVFWLLINFYILYLMISAKGGMVFSPQYREVIAKTPHIKYKTSLILKLGLALFVAVIVLGVIGAIVSSRP